MNPSIDLDFLECIRNLNVVTTPKLPPPPLTAQNKSDSSSGAARTKRPSAVTMSTPTRLSIVSPNRRLSHPMPPPRVRPPTPVCDTTPAGVTSPYRSPAASTSPSNAPPETSAVRASGSIVTSFINDRSSTIPRSQVDSPGKLWPPQRTASKTPCSAAMRTTFWTSLALIARTIAAGRRSANALFTRRSRSYWAWLASISAPSRCARARSPNAEVAFMRIPR